MYFFPCFAAVDLRLLEQALILAELVDRLRDVALEERVAPRVVVGEVDLLAALGRRDRVLRAVGERLMLLATLRVADECLSLVVDPE